MSDYLDAKQIEKRLTEYDPSRESDVHLKKKITHLKNLINSGDGIINCKMFIELFRPLLESICKRVLICDFRMLKRFLTECKEKEQKNPLNNNADPLKMLNELNEILSNGYSIQILNPELHNHLIERISFIFAYQDKSSKLSSDMVIRYFIDWLNEHHPELVDENCCKDIHNCIQLLNVADCFKATRLEPNKICLDFEEYKLWLREKRDTFLIGIAYDTIYEPKQWSQMLYNSNSIQVTSKMQSIMKVCRNREETLTKWIDKFYSEIRKVISEKTAPISELSSILLVECDLQEVDIMYKSMTESSVYTNDVLDKSLVNTINVIYAHAKFSSMIQRFINETANPKGQQKQQNAILDVNSSQQFNSSSYKGSNSMSGSGYSQQQALNRPQKAHSSYQYPNNPHYVPNYNKRDQDSLNNSRNISNSTVVSTASFSSFYRGPNTSDFSTRTSAGYRTRDSITNSSDFDTWIDARMSNIDPHEMSTFKTSNFYKNQDQQVFQPFSSKVNDQKPSSWGGPTNDRV